MAWQRRASHAVAAVWPAAGLALGLVILTGLAFLLGDPVIKRVVTEALIYVVVVVGLYIFVGNTGIVSFGHITFMLIGAYASTWQTCCPGLKSTFMPGLPSFLLEGSVPVLPAAIIAGGIAALAALVIGLPIMRLSGIGASIALFSVLAVMKTIYENWDPWTGGTTSIIGLPLYVNMAVALGWAVVAIAVAYAFQRSRLGLILRAAREDEVAARASGINVYLVRLVALVLSAFFVAVGGVLYGHYLGTVSVDVFWLDMTFITLAMLVIGGIRSLAGAVLGVVTLSILTEALRRLEEGVQIGGAEIALPDGSQEIALAVALILILFYRPQGLVGRRELTWPFLRRSSPTEFTAPAGPAAPLHPELTEAHP